MAGTEIIGWLVIAMAIAAVIARQRRRSPGRATFEVPAMGDARQTADAAVQAADAGAGDDAWCRATAALYGGSIFLFDEGLRLIASGGCVAKASTALPAPPHLIDLGSLEETAALLGGAAAARRGEVASWRMAWEGGEATATAVALDAGRLLLCIRGGGR